MVMLEESLRRGIELAGQGRLDRALAVFDEILEVYRDEPRALFNAAVVVDRLGRRDRALALLRRSITADPSFASPHYYLGYLYLQSGCYKEAYQSFRDTISLDVEFTSAYEGARTAALAMGQPEATGEADIVFYTGGNAFHGGTLSERALGGSESALIYVAQALAAKGIRVRVFCNCERPGAYNGVRYDDLVDFHIYRRQHTLPVFISSRSLRPFKLDLRAQARVLWIHDDVNVPFLAGEFPDRLPIDRVFSLSQWQKEVWSRHFNIPSERFYLTRNGVDLKLFKPVEKRARYRLIYASRPDRGLDVLLKLFPHIRRRAPDAELHVYTYQLPDDKADDPVVRQAIPQGVYIRKGLSKAALASEMAAARLMVYPSTWRETSCIAAIEAQASGTPVVASALAALPETVPDGIGGRLIPGDPNTTEFGRQFVDVVVSLMNDDEEWQRLSHSARHRIESLYDWNTIATEWVIELQRLVKERNGCR